MGLYRTLEISMVSAFLLLLSVSNSHADEASAHEVLVEKGLSKKASYYVLDSELEFGRKFREARQVKVRLGESLKRLDDFEKQKILHRRQLVDFIAERRKLNQRLGRVKTTLENNRLIARLNELTDLIDLRSQGGLYDEQEDLLHTELGNARSEYIKMVARVRRLLDQTQTGYASLATDSEVVAALAELNQTSKRSIGLGPRRNFGKMVKQFKAYEEAIEAETIELKSGSGVLWVEVRMNDNPPQRMVFDTGASMITLPAEMAASVGLHPTGDEHIIHMRIADGSTVQGSWMTLDSVRVGEFTIRNVDCVVMPAGLENVPPLLGGTFLRHFIYEVDPTTKALTLSKVDTAKRKN